MLKTTLSEQGHQGEIESAGEADPRRGPGGQEQETPGGTSAHQPLGNFLVICMIIKTTVPEDMQLDALQWGFFCMCLTLWLEVETGEHLLF